MSIKKNKHNCQSSYFTLCRALTSASNQLLKMRQKQIGRLNLFETGRFTCFTETDNLKLAAGDFQADTGQLRMAFLVSSVSSATTVSAAAIARSGTPPISAAIPAAATAVPRLSTSGSVFAVEVSPQFPRDGLQVHKVAEARTDALAHFILAAASFPEIRNGAQLNVDGAPAEPALIQLLDGSSCILLPPKFDVDVSHEMVAEIIANVHLFDFSIFVLGLDENVLEKVIIMLLHLFIADVGQMGTIR